MLTTPVRKWIRSLPATQRLALMELWVNSDSRSLDRFFTELHQMQRTDGLHQ